MNSRWKRRMKVPSATLLWGILAVVLALLGAALLSACLTLSEPCKCPPGSVTPVPVETATPVPKPEPTPNFTIRKLTNGYAEIAVDLTKFHVKQGQDYYALGTFMWEQGDLHSPALELSVRGNSDSICSVGPCNSKAGKDQPLGLVVRFSGDIGADAKQPNEKLHCGEGTNYSKRLPIGLTRVFVVRVRWAPGGVTVSTPAGSVTLRRGAARMGFGWFTPDVPGQLGIGWAYGPAVASPSGASVRVLDFDAASAEQPALGSCS